MTEETIRVRVQRDFPNCSKYKHCCDANWNSKLENVKNTPKPEMKKQNIKYAEMPNDFNEW